MATASSRLACAFVALLVLGSVDSTNAKRMRRVGSKAGCVRTKVSAAVAGPFESSASSAPGSPAMLLVQA